MVPSELGESLVEGVSDHIVIVVRGLEGAEEECLELDDRAHASELEVAHPEIAKSQAGVLPRHVEGRGCTSGHGIPQDGTGEGPVLTNVLDTVEASNEGRTMQSPAATLAVEGILRVADPTAFASSA
jgi:hypothetical protein